MRASDADRETVAERLRRAAGEGRILAQELEERLAHALRARTYGELDALVADLPREVARPRSRTRQLARSHPLLAAMLVLAAAVVTVVVVAVVIALVVAWLALAWGIWLLVGTLFVARRGVAPRGRHYYRYGCCGWQRARQRYRYSSWT
jgi:hypothetical protein